MKFPQFVKEFRNENKDLGMSHAECMKSDEIKRAYKELCGCPHIEQKDGNVNVILQFGEKENDAEAVSPDGQPKQSAARPGIPQRRPVQSADIPPMAQIPPLPPMAPIPAQEYQSYVQEEPPVQVVAVPIGSKQKESFLVESDEDTDDDTDDEQYQSNRRPVDLGQYQSPHLGAYRIRKESPKSIDVSESPGLSRSYDDSSYETMFSPMSNPVDQNLSRINRTYRQLFQSPGVEYVGRMGTDEREAERFRRANETGNYLDFTVNPSTVYEDESIGGSFGGAVLNCCPAVRGGSLKASDLRKLLSSSYSGEPVDNWKMEKSMSSKNSKVYRNPSTGQVVVAHKGTQGAMDWGNNLVYAVTGEMGYKQTKRYKDARKVQKDAENAFGRDMVTTIGHSQGGLQAQMLGGDSKEVITVNKATRPGEVLYGSSKKGNQTDVRTEQDPVSAFRSPLASRNKTVSIDANTKDPLDAHSYEHLSKLGDMEIGEKENYEIKNPLVGQGVADSRLASMEADYKRKLWEGKFNVPGEWDDKLKTWVNVKAYRAALARMDPERKRNMKMLQARLDKDRDAEAKLAIKQKKAQKGRFK